MKIIETEVSTSCYISRLIYIFVWNIFIISGISWLILFHGWSPWTYLNMLWLCMRPDKEKVDEY